MLRQKYQIYFDVLFNALWQCFEWQKWASQVWQDICLNDILNIDKDLNLNSKQIFNIFLNKSLNERLSVYHILKEAYCECETSVAMADYSENSVLKLCFKRV